MTRTSRLLMLAALQALTFSAGAANASRNLGHPTAARMIALDVVRELQTAFERRDFNSDGLVSWEEMSAGIGEGFQPSVDLHPFGAAQCRNPTLDALSFMECNVFRAREHIKAHSEEAADPSPGFDALLSSYVMQCPDAPEAWLQGRCLGSCQDCMQPEGSGRWAVEGKSPLGGTQKKHHGMLENASVGILISSDWHVEPWYFVGNATKCPSSDGTCRFAGASISNMFECHDVAGTKSPCLLDGEKDPPIQLEESHVAAAQKMGAALHFYIGDTQAHLYTGAWDGATAVKKLMDRVLSEEVGLFGARNIAWAAGNNDGPHNAIFHEQDPLTQAWAESMLRHKIVTDELDIGFNQVNLFKLTGFYVKRLPLISNASFAVVLNTNLGTSNTQQAKAFNASLAWIKDRHGDESNVYLLGHHPAVMNAGRLMVPSEYRSMVKGVFAGHVHVAYDTTADLFTQVPAVTQAATDTGFWVATVSTQSPVVNCTVANLQRYQGRPQAQANSTRWLPRQ